MAANKEAAFRAALLPERHSPPMVTTTPSTTSTFAEPVLMVRASA